MNIWTLLLIGTGAILAVGLFALLGGLLRAPTGFQDESGFHAGEEPELVEHEPAASLSQAQVTGGHFGHAA